MQKIKKKIFACSHLSHPLIKITLSLPADFLSDRFSPMVKGGVVKNKLFSREEGFPAPQKNRAYFYLAPIARPGLLTFKA